MWWWPSAQTQSRRMTLNICTSMSIHLCALWNYACTSNRSGFRVVCRFGSSVASAGVRELTQHMHACMGHVQSSSDAHAIMTVVICSSRRRRRLHGGDVLELCARALTVIWFCRVRQAGMHKHTLTLAARAEIAVRLSSSHHACVARCAIKTTHGCAVKRTRFYKIRVLEIKLAIKSHTASSNAHCRVAGHSHYYYDLARRSQSTAYVYVALAPAMRARALLQFSLIKSAGVRAGRHLQVNCANWLLAPRWCHVYVCGFVCT